MNNTSGISPTREEINQLKAISTAWERIKFTKIINHQFQSESRENFLKQRQPKATRVSEHEPTKQGNLSNLIRADMKFVGAAKFTKLTRRSQPDTEW